MVEHELRLLGLPWFVYAAFETHGDFYEAPFPFYILFRGLWVDTSIKNRYH